MNLHPWIQLFTEQILETDFWTWAAVILGIVEVFLARVNNVALYPIGIIGTIISIYVLMSVHLYAESALNVYYVVMSVYGWYYWIKKKNEPPVKISWCTSREWVITALIVILGVPVLYALYFIIPPMLHLKYTPSNVPLWDSWVAATGWAGMWLLARRKMENWILLNVSNLFAIPLMFYKKLPLFGINIFVLFVVAFFGFYQWLKIWRSETKNKQLSSSGGDLERAIS